MLAEETRKANSEAPAARDVIYMMTATPRKTPKAPPVFPNPAHRPEGMLPPLVLDLFSETPRGVDIAVGRVPRRNAAAVVATIRSANRPIHLNVDDAGGDADGALAIAIALLQYEFAVSCRIVGRCSSGAAIIALAADRHRRSIVADGSVLIHGARRIFTPEQWANFRRLPPETKQAINDSLNDTDDAFSALLRARLGVSDEEARLWLREDRKWSAAEALEKGFVHAVIDDEAPGERLNDGYGVMDASEALHGLNCAVECIAESILKCAADVIDPHINNVVLLLGFPGVDGSTGTPGMTDESPAAHGTGTAHGNAQIDTANFKFGTSSYLGDGTGDGLQFPPSTDWQIAPNSGDQFTVEAWVIPNATSETNRVIIGQGGVVGKNAFLFWCNTSGNGELAFWGTTSTGGFNWPTAQSSGLTWTIGQKYHVAADRDSSNQLRIYRDGVMVGSVSTGSVGMPDASSNGADLGVGCDSNTSISRSWNGWLDEVRVTKGVARYASDSGFTVPGAAFPRT